jgi:stage V sporulation protein R
VSLHSALLPAELASQAERIEARARELGLDFFPVRFELLDAAHVNALAAWGGFPVRYPFWRHGMEYERLEKAHHWGLSKIYELVINNDPVVAYLVRSNSRMEQKLVMAHVFGHADFFRHNSHFAGTDRHMLDTMAAHATRVRRLVDRHGQEPVERALDRALSLENLIDPFLSLRQSLRRSAGGTGRVSAPSFDVLGFLTEQAPLRDWEREILAIVRSEAYYFHPQRMTKIANEGWASYWHSRILTGGVLDAGEVVDFADCHSGATQSAPGRMNPYKLGIELFRQAERRGQDLFALRRTHCDASLVDELVDEEFVTSQALFLTGRNARSGKLEVAERDWKAVKQAMLADLSWGGLPKIELLGVGGVLGQGELVLAHHHDGRDLELASAGETLKGLAALWRAPVVLSTRVDDRKKRLVARNGSVETSDCEDAA